MKFIDTAFPLIVCVSTRGYDASEVDEMRVGFERYFERGERYAVINYTLEGIEMPGPAARKRIADWANTPRVREMSERLCVGSASVLPNALSRGVMTALLWFWKPAAPLKSFATPIEAIDWCLDQIEAAKLAMPYSRDEVHEIVAREAFGD